MTHIPYSEKVVMIQHLLGQVDELKAELRNKDHEIDKLKGEIATIERDGQTWNETRLNTLKQLVSKKVPLSTISVYLGELFGRKVTQKELRQYVRLTPEKAKARTSLRFEWAQNRDVEAEVAKQYLSGMSPKDIAADLEQRLGRKFNANHLIARFYSNPPPALLNPVIREPGSRTDWLELWLMGSMISESSWMSHIRAALDIERGCGPGTDPNPFLSMVKLDQLRRRLSAELAEKSA